MRLLSIKEFKEMFPDDYDEMLIMASNHILSQQELGKFICTAKNEDHNEQIIFLIDVPIPCVVNVCGIFIADISLTSEQVMEEIDKLAQKLRTSATSPPSWS